jgi:hypothetical protein
LAASGDGSKVFIERLIGYTHPVTAQVYDVTRRAFTAELQPAFLGPGADNGAQFSVNSAGTRMLTGEVLFNAPFASDTGFDAPYGSVRAILSKSGNLIYVWVAGGVMELRAADLSAVALFATTNPGELPLLFVTGDGKQVVMAVNNRLIFLALPSGLVAPDVMEMGNAGMAAHLSFVDQIKGFGRR